MLVFRSVCVIWVQSGGREIQFAAGDVSPHPERGDLAGGSHGASRGSQVEKGTSTYGAGRQTLKLGGGQAGQGGDGG